MTTPVWPPSVVDRRQLRVGALVAEGGEGRVYRLADQPGTLYKEYREPQPLEPLQDLIDWAEQLGQQHAIEQARLRASSAWPQAAVVGESAGLAAGLLMPEAPARFSVQHRRGHAYLANLSYLTADPVQRSAAYGVALPAPGSALRVALLYSLARLLRAMNRPEIPAGHGDLSQKNLLWSLERGPEVFLLDCDNAALATSDPPGARHPARRRAMTPNWDDPAIESGDNPTLASDRYSLALIFLRVVGAAHYPLQARQRQQRSLRVEFEIPDTWEELPEADPDAPLWALCARSLSRADPEGRPQPDEWCSALAELLGHLGAADLVETVDRLQDGDAYRREQLNGESDPNVAEDAAGPPPATANGAGPPVVNLERAPVDVEVTPVPTVVRPVSWHWMGALAENGAVGPMGAAPVPLRPGQFLREGLVFWVGAHRRAAALTVHQSSTAAGLRRFAVLVFLDLVLAGMLLFLVAMLVSPFLGL